jgi:hypothetical protein
MATTTATASRVDVPDPRIPPKGNSCPLLQIEPELVLRALEYVSRLLPRFLHVLWSYFQCLEDGLGGSSYTFTAPLDVSLHYEYIANSENQLARSDLVVVTRVCDALWTVATQLLYRDVSLKLDACRPCRDLATYQNILDYMQRFSMNIELFVADDSRGQEWLQRLMLD